MPLRGPRDDPPVRVSPGDSAGPAAGPAASRKRDGSEQGPEQRNGRESSRAAAVIRGSHRRRRGACHGLPGYRIGFFRRCPYINSSTNGTHLNCPSRASGSTFRYSGRRIVHGSENVSGSSIVASYMR